MHFQYFVAPPSVTLPAPPPIPTDPPTADLLREMISVQREQLALARAIHESNSGSARWQAFLNRWGEEFPGVGEACQKTMPHVERAFVRLIDELTARLTDDESGIDDEFSLGEFLDRFGMRLSQLGTVMNILGPLSDAARIAGEQQQSGG